jgi:hypothetical protein
MALASPVAIWEHDCMPPETNLSRIDDSASQTGPKFTFGVEELALAEKSGTSIPNERRARGGNTEARRRFAGIDPYNSTGDFDRNRAWLRVDRY